MFKNVFNLYEPFVSFVCTCNSLQQNSVMCYSRPSTLHSQLVTDFVYIVNNEGRNEKQKKLFF